MAEKVFNLAFLLFLLKLLLMKMIAGWSLVSLLVAGPAPAAESGAVILTDTAMAASAVELHLSRRLLRAVGGAAMVLCEAAAQRPGQRASRLGATR